ITTHNSRQPTRTHPHMCMAIATTTCTAPQQVTSHTTTQQHNTTRNQQFVKLNNTSIVHIQTINPCPATPPMVAMPIIININIIHNGNNNNTKTNINNTATTQQPEQNTMDNTNNATNNNNTIMTYTRTGNHNTVIVIHFPHRAHQHIPPSATSNEQ